MHAAATHLAEVDDADCAGGVVDGDGLQAGGCFVCARALQGGLGAALDQLCASVGRCCGHVKQRLATRALCRQRGHGGERGGKLVECLTWAAGCLEGMWLGVW